MNDQMLFDHLYFENDNLRLRVLGPFLEGDHTAIIVRFIREPGGWVRPPTYATENGNATVERATAGLKKVIVAGREFPSVPKAELSRPIDPFEWFRGTQHRSDRVILY